MVATPRRSPRSTLLAAQDDEGALPGAGAGLVLFDLDRTLLPGSSMFALGRALAAAGLVDRRRLLGAVAQEARYRTLGAGDVTVARLRSEALSHIAGLERAPFEAVAGRAARALVRHVTPGARLLLDRHLGAGDFVVVLSASPQELVDHLVAALGAHRAVGTRAEVVDDRYTGQLDGAFCYGAGKLTRLAAALGPVALDEAWAYADSASDLPVLAAVGHPVAVNPDRALRAVAKRRRWPVLTVG
ncbi:MAG: HAD-IB family hydrolase [Acidimicrobiia bacterium]|nr:HAD-IB family hydrolase [Acidimicrobiia bacterium]